MDTDEDVRLFSYLCSSVCIGGSNRIYLLDENFVVTRASGPCWLR